MPRKHRIVHICVALVGVWLTGGATMLPPLSHWHPTEVAAVLVTVFADGEVDRSPCGSGTAARVALLADEGRLAPGQVLIHESIIGTRFTAWVAELTRAEGRPAVVPEIQGNAFITGEHVFVLDLRDELGTGFVLR